MKIQNLLATTAFAMFVFSPCATHAGSFTDTLPQGAWLLDTNYTHSWLDSMYDDYTDYGPLIDKIERYEPGGGLQGILIPNVKVQYQMVITQLQYGIIKELSVGIGIPVVVATTVDPNFSWIPGDYQWGMGRSYSQDDFWAWAKSMGQNKPGRWVGNEGTLSDIILGIRWRYTDRFKALKDSGFSSAFSFLGAIPTGTPPDPENLLGVGTTMWDLHAQGELNFHIGLEYEFKKELDDRLTLGLDLFYEVFLPHTYTTPTGRDNPLLLTYSPYVGSTYHIDGGDFLGFTVGADVVPVKGPALASWISGHDKLRAEQFPPLLSLSFKYSFTYLQQTDWTSESVLWDWDREKLWHPGYKNILMGKITFSFMRLGAPLQLYATYRTLGLIPGMNTRAAEAVSAGFTIPFKFW